MENTEKGYFDHYIQTPHEMMKQANDVFVSGVSTFNIYTAVYLILVVVSFWKNSPAIAPLSIFFTFYALSHLGCISDKIKFYDKLYKSKLETISEYTREQKIHDFFGVERVKSLKLEVDNPTNASVKLLTYMYCMTAVIGIGPLAIFLFKL